MAQLADVTTSVETPADFGADPQGVAARWISELTLAEKDHTAWRTRARKVIKKYRNDQVDPSNDTKARRFALLWSNMETLGPATYARLPQAVVGRRWKDQDPIGRMASEVLERGLNFTLDSGDFLDSMRGIRNEYLLTGRGVAWVRYVPQMRTVNPADGDPQEAGPDGQIDEGAESYEEVAWEEVVFDHVSYDDFLHNPARKWSEVRWVCRIAYLTRDELIDRFGEELGKEIPLDHGENETGRTGADGDDDKQWKKAAIYEIWDKPSRKAIWVSKGYSEAVLDERDDPLALKDFFPCPRPALGTCAPDSILPIPDFAYYESQVKDIDELTARIGLLTDALKLRGFYAAGGEQKDKLQDLFASETNTLIPVDSWAAFAEKGGVKGLIEWVPIDLVASALKGCIEARQQLIQDVYQITGIADIMRGDVDPDETATATKAKGNWGSLRVRDKQKELARFTRSLLRIGAEIIATKFSPETLAQMSNLQLFKDQAEKAQVQQQLQMQAQQAQAMAQHAQQMGQPAPPPPQPPPQLIAQLSKPTWQDLEGLLRNNTLRGFRIDVETDSTIEPNDQEEKQRRIEFVEAIGQYIAHSLPVLQTMPALVPVICQGLLFLVRGFRVGREMEDVIEQALDKLQSTPPSPPPQAQQKPGELPQVQQARAQADTTRAQASTVSAQADMLRAQTDARAAQADTGLRQQQIRAEDMRSAADRQSDQQMHGQDLAADIHKAVMQAVSRSTVRDINSTHPIEAPTR